MKVKKLLSLVVAVGMTSAVFGGLQPSVSAAADTVTFWDLNAEQATVLDASWPSYDSNGDNVMDVVFDDAADTVTFNSDITLRSCGVSGTWFSCVSATGPSGAKSMTMNIPDGVTVTMDNTGEASGWSTALNGTSTGDLVITGGGTLIVNGGGSGGAFGITPYAKSITIDGVDVKTNGSEYGVGYYSGGSLTIQNGGSLEATGGLAAFESGSAVTAEGATIIGGNDAGSASSITADQIASYKYVKIDMGGSDVPVGPTQIPATPDPDLPTENFSRWVGIQTTRDGAPEWLYNGHYLMPDGTHLNTTNNGEPDGSEAVYYDGITGTLTFSKDITIYSASDGSYYGSGISWEYGVENVDTNMVIRLEDGANVTIDATNRDADEYLYGIYGNGTLVVTGDGTLTIKANEGTVDNYAMCVYNGKDGSGLANIIIKDNVTLNLEDEDVNGIGIGVYGPGVGNITIKDNAVVEAYGGKQAINKVPIIPDSAFVSVGDSKDTAEEWDKTSDITQYKYVKINAAEEGPQETEPAVTATPAPATATPSPTPTATEPVATEEPQTLPETGIIWHDDYEKWHTYDWQSENLAEMRVANGGDYGNIYRMNIGLAEGHGKVLYSTTEDDANRGFDWYPDDMIGADEYVEINDGILRLSAQVCIPGGFVMNSEDQELNNYVWTWTKASLEGDSPNNRAYLFKVGTTYGDPQGKISFQTGAPNQLVSADASNSVNIDFDTWHTIDVIINYDAGVVDYYVDGNFVAMYPGAPDDVSKYFPVAYMQLHQNGRFTESDDPLVFLWDNFTVERLDDSLDAEAVESGDNYVDVRFTKAVPDSELSSTGVSVRVAGDNSSLAASTGYTRLSADTVRFTFDSLLPATAYELIFEDDIESTYGSGIIDAGSIIVFTTPVPVTETTLVDMTFDDASGDYYLVHSKSSEDLTFVDDKDNTSNHAEIRDGVLYYDHYLDVEGQERNGLKFPFADGTTVESGKITMEFDAGVSGETGRTRAVFGLEDPEKTDTGWSPATVFAGIAPYDGNRLSFTVASESKRNALTGDSGMDITAAITGSGEMHHYKAEIDIDNTSYKLYYDGALAADLDYIPGGSDRNSFNSFIMSGVYASSNYASDSGKTFIMLDNLKIIAEKSATAVGSITFVKYDGTEMGYSSTVPAGTKEIKISFTKEMAADTAEHISIDGIDTSSYEVTCSGSEAVITFVNCLEADTPYILRVDADTADADGGTLAGEAVYRFTADAGEVIYEKPVIHDNGDTVTAEVAVVNTTANEIDNCCITLAAYSDDNTMTGITMLEAEYKKAEGYTKTFSITADSEAFAAADRLGAFVFSDLATIRPLTEKAEVQR